MRVCFVLPSLRPSGGVAVVRQHARALAAGHGVDAEIAVIGSLAEARGERYDVVIGTWWETAAPALTLAAERHCILLQSFEQRFYGRDAPFERLSAEATLALPVGFVAVAGWIRDLLAELRPGARSWVVRPGIDKAVFSGSRTPRDGPLEVLIEGQPTLPLKGVAEALAAVSAMREPVRTTLVALDPEAAGDVPVDRVVGGLDPEGMAELYRESDVLLKLSRVEGLGLAPVEGFHSGLPCVVTPYTGHAEYVRHSHNGLIMGFDDVPGTAAALDALARDRALLGRLSDGALADAAGWPSIEESAASLYGALTELLSASAPEPDEELLRGTLELAGHVGRAHSDRRRSATEDALTRAEALVRELSAAHEECAGALAYTREELERIQSTRAYRAGRAAKRAVRKVTRR